MQAIKISLVFLLLLMSTNAHSQFFKKLGEKAGKAAERAVERTVEKRVEKETSESTDRVLDSVVDAPKKKRKSKRKKSKNIIGGDPDTSETAESETTSMKVNANFDFQPGSNAILEDNFKVDAPGDFPSKWDTNGSGEIVTVQNEHWFRLGNSSTFIPMTNKPLPENYTIEFDLLTQGIDKRTSSQAWFRIYLEDTPSFQKGKNSALTELSICNFIASPGVVQKYVNGKRTIRNPIGKDYRNKLNKVARVSIAVNKTRMRVWIDDNKIIDVPRLVPEGASYFKIRTQGLRDAREHDEIYISNFRIAQAGSDKRSKLLTEGRLSTNAILFNSGSDQLQNDTNDIITEIAQAMKSHPDIKIMIVGHTDSDGDAASNLKLSQDRAETVKNKLVQAFVIDANRIFVTGKGEDEPLTSNDTGSGKKQNRRVEFIKI